MNEAQATVIMCALVWIAVFSSAIFIALTKIYFELQSRR